MFDNSWNKGNQRLSQAWEKASKKQDAPAANAAPASVLLRQVLASDQRKWKGGALKRVGDGLRENEERAAHPKLNMGQPAPRPPAPTARFGANPLSRGAPSAPAATQNEKEKRPVVDDAMREQMERRRLEALRKLAARAPALGAPLDAPPVRAPAPRHPPEAKPSSSASASASRRSFEFGPSRDGAGRRVSGGASTRGARAASDATSPDQFFGLELFLANEASPDGSVEGFDRLHVRAKSFPGYPANAVLSWATSPASPAGETKKWLLEKGELAVWRVTPATAYRALADRAAREPLLAVRDAVATRIERAKTEVAATTHALARAEEECAALGVDVPADVAERARAATAREKKASGKKSPEGVSTRASSARVLGATRRRPPDSKPPHFVNGDLTARVPRFERPAWESTGGMNTRPRRGDADDSRVSPSGEDRPRGDTRDARRDECVGGFDEKGLASVLAAATQLAPGRRVSPATADAADFVRVLRYAQRQHSLDLGAPETENAKKNPPSAEELGETLERLPPLVLRAARRCGFPADFARRASTLAKVGVCAAAPEAPPAGTADEVLDLVSDDEDDVVVVDEDEPALAADPAETPPAKPAPFVSASPSVLASALAELRAAARDLEEARAELERVEKAVRNVVKRKRARAFGPREAVFEETAFGLGVDFATGAGAGWEGRGTTSMGMDVNAW